MKAQSKLCFVMGLFLFRAVFANVESFAGDSFIETIRENRSSKLIKGDTEGHGGDSVQCVSGEVTTTSVLDTYEAKVTFPWLTLDLGPEELNLDQRVQYLIERLRFIDPVRAEHWKKEGSLFLSRVTWVQEDLPFIQDTGKLVIFPNCKVKQLAIRYKKDGKISYKVNEPLWKLLPPAERAVLVLHEIIYTEGVNVGQKDSEMSRYFNIALLTKRVKDFDNEFKYTNWLKEIGWDVYVKAGVPLTLADLKFQDSWILQGSIYLGPEEKAVITIGRNRFRAESEFNTPHARFSNNELTLLYHVRPPKILLVGPYSFLTDETEQYIGIRAGEFRGMQLFMTNVLRLQKKEVYVGNREFADFSPEGTLEYGTIARDVRLKCESGFEKQFQAGEKIYVGKNELITNCDG